MFFAGKVYGNKSVKSVKIKWYKKQNKWCLRLDLVVTKAEKKITSRIVGFAVLAYHRVKMKESEKNDKYQAITRELKKNCGTWKWRL